MINFIYLLFHQPQENQKRFGDKAHAIWPGALVVELAGTEAEEEREELMEEPKGDDCEEEEREFRSAEEIVEIEAKKKAAASKPPPFQLLRWQAQNQKQHVRHEAYGSLRNYEAQRRTTFSAKLESTQLYLNSLMEILQNSFDETAKVYRLARGTSIAQSQYARAVTERGPHQAPRDSSPSASLLHSWQESNTLLAATLEESAEDIEKKVVSILSDFQDALQDQKNQFENIGKPILHELEHMETQVQETWDAYWKTANKTMEAAGAARANVPFIQSSSEAAVVAAGGQNIEHAPAEDLWMVEMRYQFSVSLQKSTWEKRGSEIVRLANSSKEMEVTRRIKLNECMVTFLHCLQKLFTTIGKEEDVKVPVSSFISSPDPKLENTQEDIEKIMDLPDVISIPGESASGFDLDSNSNGLVMIARVLEWKNSNSAMSVADRWRTALAVITVDEYLHLFDLTTIGVANEDEIYPGSDPKTAMEYLFPLCRKTSQEEEDTNKGGYFSSVRDKMVPEMTIRLNKNCSFQLLHQACCEITQTASAGTAGRLLGKKATPLLKAQLRIILPSNSDSSDMDSLFSILKKTIK